MAEKDSRPLVPRRLLTSKRFRDDLKSFLSLPSNAMSAIASLANDVDGFDPSQKAALLSERSHLTPDEASQILTTAGYFYDRVTERRLAPSDAVQVLGDIGVSLGLSLSEDQRHALEEVLSYKKEYERGKYARLQAVNVGPHFLALEGGWSIKVFRTRQDEQVKVALLGLSVIWHDGHGNYHEAFFNMTDD